MESHQIARLQKQTGEVNWVNWAMKIHWLISGRESTENDDIAELRLNIEEGLSNLLAKRRPPVDVFFPMKKTSRKDMFVLSD
jgi:hypothetical protein